MDMTAYANDLLRLMAEVQTTKEAGAIESPAGEESQS
jgi:hypothetical protein